MKRIIFVLTSLLCAATAYAGLVQPAPVTIDGNTATGDMVSARFSANDIEYIGCGVRSFADSPTTVFSFGFCQAVNAAGDNLFCATENPALVETLRSVADFSFITFSVDDAGDCVGIGISTQSFYIPASLAPDNDDDSDTDS